MLKYDVFLSHATEDKCKIAEPIAELLRMRKYDVFYDKWSIKKGDLLFESIVTSLEQSRCSIVILSSNFLNKRSEWTRLELGKILADSYKYRRPILIIAWKLSFAQISKYFHPIAARNMIFADEKYNIAEIIHILKDKGILPPIEISNLLDVEWEMIPRILESRNNYMLMPIARAVQQLLEYKSKDPDILSAKFYSMYNTIADILLQGSKGKPKKDKMHSIDVLYKKSILPDPIYYLLKQNINRTKAKDIQITEMQWESLKQVLNWYFVKNEVACDIRDTLCIVSPSEFHDEEIQESFEIERKCLPHHLISPVAVVKRWHKHNNQMLFGVRDLNSRKLIGFINALPVTDKLFAKLMTGKVTDVNLPISDIQCYLVPGFYHLYFCSICIDPDFDNRTPAFRRLYQYFIGFLLNMAKSNEIFIKDIIADAITSDGERLCSSFGLKFVRHTSHNSKLFYAALIPPEWIIRGECGKMLYDYYKKVYRKYSYML